MTRENLIKYIRERDIFYSGTSFAGHSMQQLKKIKARIEPGKNMKANGINISEIKNWLTYANVVIKAFGNNRN